MTPDDHLDELLGAYALDAVDDIDRQRVEAYLADHPEARAEVWQMRQAASMLAHTGNPAPEGVWDRIADTLEERPPRLDGRARRQPAPAPRRWLAAALAAAALLIAAAGRCRDRLRPRRRRRAEATRRSSRPTRRRGTIPTVDWSASPRRTARCSAEAVVQPDGVGFLSAGTLPELPASETYQLWGVYSDGDVISLGVVGNRPAIEPFAADGRARRLGDHPRGGWRRRVVDERRACWSARSHDGDCGRRRRLIAADVVDAVLEAAVVPSFTRVGCAVRSRLDDWTPLAEYQLDGRVVLVTGRDIGLGRAAAELLAGPGATVILHGRDAVKAEARPQRGGGGDGQRRRARRRRRPERARAVRHAAAELLDRFDRLDVVIHNAGALQRRRARRPPTASRRRSPCRSWLRSCSLACCSIGSRAAGPGRVLTMSSGGMYTAPLAVADLEMAADDYRGTDQYAQAKRAQVTLNEMWASAVDRHEVVFHAVHPGWADTPGVESSLPRFHRALRAAAPHARRGRRHDRLAGRRRRPTARQHRRLLARPAAASDPSARPHPAQRHRRTTAGAVGVVRRAQRRRPVSSRGGPRAEYLSEDSSNVLAADERHTPPPPRPPSASPSSAVGSPASPPPTCSREPDSSLATAQRRKIDRLLDVSHR